jgi:hypothetical protein
MQNGSARKLRIAAYLRSDALLELLETTQPLETVICVHLGGQQREKTGADN